MQQKSPARASDLPFQSWPNWPARSIKPAVEAMVTWNGKLSSNLAEFNEEYATFLRKRFQADVALLERASACGRPDEVLALYSDFALRAAHDYHSEYAEFAKRWTKLVAEGFATVEAFSRSAAHPN